MRPSYRKFDEPERMRGIVEQHASRKAKKRGAAMTIGTLATVLANKALTKSIPSTKTRHFAAAAIGALAGVGAGALQGKMTDRKIRRLEDPETKHLIMEKKAMLLDSYLKNTKTASIKSGEDTDPANAPVTAKDILAMQSIASARLSPLRRALIGARVGADIGATATIPTPGGNMAMATGSAIGGGLGFITGMAKKKAILGLAREAGMDPNTSWGDISAAISRKNTL